MDITTFPASTESRPAADSTDTTLPEYTRSSAPSNPTDQQAISHDSPPNYTIAASSSEPVTHHFVRRNRWSSKVYVQSGGVDRYCFAPGKNARVWIYAGASTSNTSLGYLTFPTSHNAVRLYFGAGEEGKAGPSGMDENGLAFSDVKARVGYPHPSSFSFRGTTSDRVREYEWVNRDPSRDVAPVHYDLSVSGPLGIEALATLSISRKGNGKTFMQWRKAPENELEQAFLILSAIGVITRLSKKGSYRDNDIPQGERWFAFWWMAALSTAAIL